MKYFIRASRVAAALMLSLGCIAMSHAVHAQQKCKFVYEQADPFTKKTIYNSQQPIGPLMGGWSFILRQEGEQYFIGVGEQNGQGTTDKLAKGSKIDLMLANGGTIEIVTTKEYESTPLKLGDNMFSQWVVCEPVSKATFAKLGESPITALKTTMIYKGDHREFVLPGIKDRQGERIMKTAACMTTNQ